MIDIQWNRIANPIRDTDPEVMLRDPLLHYHDGVFRCFHSAVEWADGLYSWYVDMITSRDLINWSRPVRLTKQGHNLSSPGNIIRKGDGWVMCAQSYHIPRGQKFAGEDARVWYLHSEDLENWSEPIPISPQGAQVNWSDSHRQIDPCFAEHDGRWWCVYKTDGRLGVLVSEDFEHWAEASPDRPILDSSYTPDGVTVENPCIIRDGDDLVMFFAPCRLGRGVGVARSRDMLHWNDVRYLDFPELSWAGGGATAPMVADLRDVCGKWVMAFHGDRHVPRHHCAALGIAWSDDLEHWSVPWGGE